MVQFLMVGCIIPPIIRPTAPPDLTSPSDCQLPEPVRLAIDRNPTATLSEMAEAVHIGWAVLSSIHRVDILPVAGSEEVKRPLLLVQWTGPLMTEEHPARSSLSLLWQTDGTWQEQTFCGAEQALVDAQLLEEEGYVILQLVVDPCGNATERCPQTVHYQLVDGTWRPIEGTVESP